MEQKNGCLLNFGGGVEGFSVAVARPPQFNHVERSHELGNGLLGHDVNSFTG